jgi:hypothetical protein
MMENATVIGKYMEILYKEPVLDRTMLGNFYSVHLHVFALSGFRHVFIGVCSGLTVRQWWRVPSSIQTTSNVAILGLMHRLFLITRCDLLP